MNLDFEKKGIAVKYRLKNRNPLIYFMEKSNNDI